MITLDHIRAAARKLPHRFVFTPCIQTDAFLPLSSGSFFLKCENLQPMGAYKIRAASHVMSGIDDPDKKVAISSSGNFARAFAYVGRMINAPVITVMMKRTEAAKVDAVRALGAEVILCDNRHEARWETLNRLKEDPSIVTINTYESRDVIAGHGTIGIELLQQTPQVDTVLVPVSSGGLIAGIATAVKQVSPKVQVIGVQPELSRAAFESFRAGTLVAVEESRSVCDAIVATRPGELPFRHMMKYVDDVLTVSDRSVLDAVRLFANACSLVVEPSGALPAAAVLERARDFAGRNVVLVVSGGNVAPARLAEILQHAPVTSH